MSDKSKVYHSKVLEICDNGDAIIELTEELCDEMGWTVGDELDIQLEGETVVIKKLVKGEEMVYECEVCGHIHDEATMGKLDDLPKYANCPDCGSDAREVYKPVEL